MNDPRQPKTQPAVVIASAALALLVLTNLAWLVAYSALSQKVIGVAAVASGSPAPSASPTPTAPAETQGDISGNVGFPAGSAPAQTVCAVSTADASKKYCTDFAGGNSLAYEFTVPAGKYYVYASLKAGQGNFTPAYKAYYDKFVTCGGGSSCPASGHTDYLPVAVTAGLTTNDVNPTDWYGTPR